MDFAKITEQLRAMSNDIYAITRQLRDVDDAPSIQVLISDILGDATMLVDDCIHALDDLADEMTDQD